jgi:membrane protease subunit (stomatin/prohibitin family)
MRDGDFGMVRLRGYGVYSFRITDASKFMKEMFGTNNLYTTEDVANQLRPMVIQAITDTIAESKISLLDLAANYKEFSETVTKSATDFDNYGIKLEKLVVENISLPEDVEKALDERSKLGIMEDKMGTYAQYQAATAMRDAANNPNGSNMAALGVGFGVAGAMGEVFAGSMNNIENKSKTKTKQCIKCGAEIAEKSKHCSECGAPQNPICPKCKEMVSSRAKFCPNCGEKIAPVKKVCANCGEELKSTAKFCPNCGEKTK